MSNANQHPAPCPSCGHCPTCGHTPQRAAAPLPWYPTYPYPYYPSPWWGVVPPRPYQWPLTATTVTDGIGVSPSTTGWTVRYDLSNMPQGSFTTWSAAGPQS